MEDLKVKVCLRYLAGSRMAWAARDRFNPPATTTNVKSYHTQSSLRSHHNTVLNCPGSTSRTLTCFKWSVLRFLSLSRMGARLLTQLALGMFFRLQESSTPPGDGSREEEKALELIPAPRRLGTGDNDLAKGLLLQQALCFVIRCSYPNTFWEVRNTVRLI